MKKSLLLVSTWLIPWMLWAQNDAQNFEKYWKLRNQFREKYIKIGDGPGQGLPAWAVKPKVCVDNLNFDGIGFGEMHWGDGMIHQGYYLGLLATEYRLLKDAGQDVTGVLNELFFALNAINRVDYDAEDALEEIYSMSINPSLNGYYIREDVGEDFALNWQDEAYECRCTNSNFYTNNNAAKVHDPSAGYVTKGNSYQNTPSLDQLTALLVGFSLVHKLVDDVYVQPPGMSYGFYIKTENAAITDRMIRYIADHNWFMIDVNGWPVNNGGGDCLLAAYPLLEAAKRITGNDNYIETWNRRSIPYNLLQHCITGKGVTSESAEDQDQACNWNTAVPPILINTGQVIASDAYVAADLYLSQYPNPGVHNNQNTSRFQSWQNSGMFFGNTDFSIGIWEDLIPNHLDDMATTTWWANLFMTLNPQVRYYDPMWVDLNGAHLDKPWIKDYNLTILYNLGVTSGKWNSLQSWEWANMTGNRANELTNAVLFDLDPAMPHDFYADLLNDLTALGPYYFQHEEEIDNDPLTIVTVGAGHDGAWKSPYRWTHPEESVNGDGGKQGIYDGLDYMFFHNLVQLAFGNNPFTNPETYSCICDEIPYKPTPTLPELVNGTNAVNEQLSYLPDCAASVLDPIDNDVWATYEVKPKFDNYISYGINPPKYQREDAVINPDSYLKVKTKLVLCEYAVLTILSNATQGNLIIEDGGEVILTSLQRIDNHGIIHVKSGGKLIINDDSDLILFGGSKLILDDGAIVEVNSGQIWYDNGAAIINNGASVFKINNGQITIRTPNTTFKVNNSNSWYSTRFEFSGHSYLKYNANSSTYEFTGKNSNEVVFELKQGAKVVVQESSPSWSNSKIYFGQMAMNFSVNSELQLLERMKMEHVNATGSALNKGILLTQTYSGTQTAIHHSNFADVPVNAALNVANTTKLNMVSNNFSASFQPPFNQTEVYLLKVTGQSLTATDCHFSGLKGGCVTIFNTLYPSLFSQCSFNGPTSPTAAISGIGESSNAETKVSTCTFTNLHTGMNKSYGKATVRCNDFNNQKYPNLRVLNGILNISGATGAGYNEFDLPETDATIIDITNADLQLINGYNKFDAPFASNQYYIKGSVSTPCSPIGSCHYLVTKNQWGTSVLSNPNQNRFLVTGSNGQQFNMSYSPNHAFPACGAFDPPPVGGGSSGKSGRANENSDESPLISMAGVDSITLNDALYYGLSKMTLYNERGNDLEALKIFDAIFKSGVTKERPATRHTLRQVGYLMKSALESAFSDDLLKREDNVSEFDEYTQMYVDALNFLTDEEIDDLNYKTQFLIELDKVQLFRMLNKPQVAKALLEELEYCGLEHDEQLMVNHWKEQVEIDIIVQTHGCNVIDSTITIDTDHYKKASTTDLEYKSFGAKIVGANRIEYPSCDYFNISANGASNGLYVYPNPSNTMVNVVIDLGEFENAAALTVESLDGKLIKTIALSSVDSGIVEVNCQNFARGTYFIKVRGANNKMRTGKFIKN